NGDAPDHPERWGWRSEDARNEFGLDRVVPRGDRVGWVHGDDLYLEPEAAFAAVQRFGADGGEGLAVGLLTLKKRLHEQRLLKSAGAGGGKRGPDAGRGLQGGRRPVLHLPVTAVFPAADVEVAPGPPDDNAVAPPDSSNEGAFAPPGPPGT